MDDLSASLVLSLQIEDVDVLLQGCKGKSPEGRRSDADIALSAYRDELLNSKMRIDDRRMGRSIADAVRTDGTMIATARVEEQNTTRDHEVACRLGGIEPPKQLTLDQSSEPYVEVEVLRQLIILNSSANEEDLNYKKEAEGSSSNLVQGTGEDGWSNNQKQCVACQEDKHKHDTLEAPCTHTYCHGCISELFEGAVRDESLFPPRCCREVITLNSVKAVLSDPLISQFTAKAVEWGTLKRTYCALGTCSTFIPPESISGEIATCPTCGETTCLICNKSSHDGDCPDDEPLQSLLTTAAANKWQRCYSCGRMVEITYGCNHITYVFSTVFPYATRLSRCSSCLCKSEFCYECGQKWKECGCEQWIEGNLLARAEQIVRRDDPADLTDVQQRIRRVAIGLRERHECAHVSWRIMRGRYRCEECRHELPNFINRCRECDLQVCKRCRLNRL
jgi:hypothetical protein